MDYNDAAQRFWGQVERRGPAECWPWTGQVGRQDGHGRFSCWIGGKRRQMNAHKFAWCVVHGEPDKHKFVLHTCENKLCCNVSHMFLSFSVSDPRRPRPATRNEERAGGVTADGIFAAIGGGELERWNASKLIEVVCGASEAMLAQVEKEIWELDRRMSAAQHVRDVIRDHLRFPAERSAAPTRPAAKPKAARTPGPDPADAPGPKPHLKVSDPDLLRVAELLGDRTSLKFHQIGFALSLPERKVRELVACDWFAVEKETVRLTPKGRSAALEV